MVDKLINPFTLLSGPVLVAVVIWKTTIPIEDGGYHLPWWNVVISYVVWLMATRTAKLLPHLWHRPQDIVHVPAFILFGYYFAVMKLYALFTLHETGWGTRAGIGDPTAATAAADKRAVATLNPDEKYQKLPPIPQTQYTDASPNYQQQPMEMQVGYAR